MTLVSANDIDPARTVFAFMEYPKPDWQCTGPIVGTVLRPSPEKSEAALYLNVLHKGLVLDPSPESRFRMLGETPVKIFSDLSVLLGKKSETKIRWFGLPFVFFLTLTPPMRRISMEKTNVLTLDYDCREQWVRATGPRPLVKAWPEIFKADADQWCRCLEQDRREQSCRISPYARFATTFEGKERAWRVAMTAALLAGVPDTTAIRLARWQVKEGRVMPCMMIPADLKTPVGDRAVFAAAQARFHQWITAGIFLLGPENFGKPLDPFSDEKQAADLLFSENRPRQFKAYTAHEHMAVKAALSRAGVD